MGIVCVCVCSMICLVYECKYLQRPEEGMCPLELELQIVVATMWT